MTSTRQIRNWFFGIVLRATTAALALTVVFGLMTTISQSLQAQTYKVLYNFTGQADGLEPEAGMTMDKAANLYGTTIYGGTGCGGGEYGCGTAFKLKRAGSGWIFDPLYSFQGGSDGAYPAARVIFGSDGSLYGTTTAGGGCPSGNGCGTVFNLRPQPKACTTALCPWKETLLYSFAGSDGAEPYSEVVFDHVGNLYGTTTRGGSSGYYGDGVVYELTPSNGGWSETILHGFTGGTDGAEPYAGLIFDNVGNLYGTTYEGGNLACSGGGGQGCGVVFQLAPVGSGWTENILYSFQSSRDGAFPMGGLIFDQFGNLYGTTPLTYGGMVFMLTPSQGNWAFTLLYSFSGPEGPEASLVMDAAGNLYGTRVDGGAYEYGSVFKLTPSSDGWTYTSLHDFCPNGFPACSDGAYPVSNVVIDTNGNLYGTAALGGTGCPSNPNGCGVVWEITP